jgi:hypothetical protein
MMVHRMIGMGFWHRGRPLSCRAHLELYDRSVRSAVAAERALPGIPVDRSSSAWLLQQSNLRHQEARAETQKLIAANPTSCQPPGSKCAGLWHHGYPVATTGGVNITFATGRDRLPAFRQS